MTSYERRQSMIELLRQQPGLRIHDFAKTFGVLAGTIRNDFNALEKQGLLIRVHGGAVLDQQDKFQYNSFKLRYQKNAAEKLAIATAAAALIEDGDSFFIDSSSTAFYLGQALSARHRLRAVTNGFEIARKLANNPSNSVILIGGVVNNESSSVTGMLSEQTILKLHTQKAFVSCSGFSLERGLTEVYIAEAQIKQIAIHSSQQLIALIASSKFGKEDLTPFASSEQITHLFTGAGLTPEWIEKLNRARIHFTICTETEAEAALAR